MPSITEQLVNEISIIKSINNLVVSILHDFLIFKVLYHNKGIESD
jgi:hypothetical protein